LRRTSETSNVKTTGFDTLEDIYESRLLEETLKKGKFHTLEEVARRMKVEL
jgi:hypothetical protein